MGRTIPSYRIGSEMEIWKWRPFRKLLDKQDRKVFDEMLIISRFYNVAGTMTCRPILSHVIIMSIIFEHFKQLTKLATQKKIIPAIDLSGGSGTPCMSTPIAYKTIKHDFSHVTAKTILLYKYNTSSFVSILFITNY